MLDLTSGLPYFWILNGLPHHYPVLASDVSSDVLVVGGGITGALVAQACVVAGLSTTVIDARPIATGSSAGSTALLQYEIDTPLHRLAKVVGEDHAARAYRAGLEALHYLHGLATVRGSGGVRQRPSLQFASKRSHEAALREEHGARRRHGIAVDLLAPGVTKERWGIDAMALLSPDAGELDPYAFTHALLQEVVRLGGSVFERTEAVHFARDGASGHVVRTRSGLAVRARHLVMATGYESQRYLPAPLLQLHSTYAVASERTTLDPIWHQDALIWETATPYLYARTTNDRRVLVGGMDEPFRDPGRRDALLARKTQRLVKAFGKLFPFVPFVPEYAWCGTFGSTKDGLPFIDRDAVSGAWFVLGMGGNGITFSALGAGIVRDALLGRPNAHADLFRFDR